MSQDANAAQRLVIVGPEPSFTLPVDRDLSRFRVCVRIWEDAQEDAEDYDPMPGTWVYYIAASNADAARTHALERFPAGAKMHTVFEDPEDARLDRADLARISIDIQRLHLDQRLKEGPAFHIVGRLCPLREDVLPQLAAHLDARFSAAVVARDGEDVLFGVSVNAESFEEADADFEDALEMFTSAFGLEEHPISGSSTGRGERNAEELLAEMQGYRR